MIIDLNFEWQILTYLLTIFVCFLIPVYWYHYGIRNFLWLSDVGLLLTPVALWKDSTLLMSMAVVGVLIPELIWNLDFFLQLFFNVKTLNIADYMFSSRYSLPLRALSLYHIFLPIIWIVYLAQFGYDKKALYNFTSLYWIILLITYLFTDPKENINWVFFPQRYNVKVISPRVWVLILAAAFPLCIFVPTHYLCLKFFKAA
ncbi:membrane-associated protein [Candidatus Dependentiae bacterium]|nr:membrane-associated protein [Candidatus Dependentiae bacterium]